MKFNNTTFLITAAALAILALIAIQLSWMRQSRRLLEEQFNNRVNMALCSTVEKLADNPASTDQVRACCLEGNDNSAGCAKTLDELRQMPEMSAALTQALEFYQIELPHSILITQKDSASTSAETMPFACSLTPILENDSHVLQLQFDNKEEYISAKMGMMTALSLAILALISIVFALASYYLLRQKKMSDLNRDFFNHMTHEFRTPLTNIRLAGNLFVRKNPAFADNQYLSIIRNECQQLTEQVENVLHLATLEKGDYQLKKESIDLQQVLHNTLDQMEIQIRDRSADVRLLDNSAGPVLGDAFHLSNAFRNLLDNALKYNLSAPEVRIGVEQLKDQVKISFSDNGIGLSEKDQKRIFEKFQRCDDTSVISKGFGLGLAYVKKIIDLHGGRVEVRSQEGRGTRFDLYLPA